MSRCVRDVFAMEALTASESCELHALNVMVPPDPIPPPPPTPLLAFRRSGLRCRVLRASESFLLFFWFIQAHTGVKAKTFLFLHFFVLWEVTRIRGRAKICCKRSRLYSHGP